MEAGFRGCEEQRKEVRKEKEKNCQRAAAMRAGFFTSHGMLQPDNQVIRLVCGTELGEQRKEACKKNNRQSTAATYAGAFSSQSAL